MKKYLALTILAAALAAQAGGLKLSPQARQEADLLMDFLAAEYTPEDSPDKLFAAYQKVWRREPDSPYLKRLLVAAALAGGQADKAEPYADFITPQSDAEDYTVYAAYLWKKNDLNGAEKNYEKALALAPDDVRILYQYVLLLSFINPDKAIQKLEDEADSSRMLAPHIYTEIGNLYARRAQTELAVLYYAKALQEDDALPAAYLGRAAVYEQTGQYAFMLADLLAAEKLQPLSAEAYTRIAATYWLAQQTDQAETYFLKAKKADTHDINSARSLAEIARQRGDYDQAVRYLKDARDFDSNPDRWLQIAALLYQQGHTEEFTAWMKKTYQKFSQNIEVSHMYAMMLYQAHRDKPALRALNKILASNPNYDDARTARAALYARLHDYSAMEKDLDFLLAKNPQNAAALNMRAYAYAQRGIRLDEAEKLAMQALELNPKSDANLDTLAWVYFKQGRLPEAEKLLFSFPEGLWKQEPELAYHIGAVLFAQDRYEEARPYLEAARTTIKEAGKLYKKIPADL